MTQRSIEIASPKVMKFRHVRAHADAATVAPRGDERQQAMSAVNVGAASELGPEMDAPVTRMQPRSETWLTASQGCAQY